MFPSDNQHDSDAAFPQEGVGLAKVDPKNAHLALSHGYPSPAVRFQQVIGISHNICLFQNVFYCKLSS
ncbi:unnamed protein product [Schistosoma curassoni]|uniref:Uncharacterized protein n=1 Tax=Schistosoma curassoni TaxID=6186 RepID=A0A183KH36_9TREM|nr:unnamed protein product [Schistosoma curassoni]